MHRKCWKALAIVSLWGGPSVDLETVTSTSLKTPKWSSIQLARSCRLYLSPSLRKLPPRSWLAGLSIRGLVLVFLWSLVCAAHEFFKPFILLTPPYGAEACVFSWRYGNMGLWSCYSLPVTFQTLYSEFRKNDFVLNVSVSEWAYLL